MTCAQCGAEMEDTATVCPACGSLNQTSVTEEGQTFEERDGHLVTFAPGFTCNRCDRLLAVHGSEWGTE